MKLVFTVLIVSLALMGCSKSSSSGENSAPPPSGDTTNPENIPSGSAFACMVIEPVSKKAYVNFGDTAALASEHATEFCVVQAGAAADCRSNVRCEQRVETSAWSCTVTNSVNGDVFDAKERSKIEAYSMAHGICSASINGSPTVCSTPETANCVLQQ